MTQNRSKLFLENILVYGFGGMISKLIPFIMLPIITRLYPNSEYIGLNDLSTTFVQFAAAIAVCGMYDAMFRLFFDDDKLEAQQKVCSTALIFVIGTTVALSVLCYLFRYQIARIYFGGEQYVYLVMITVIGFLVSSTNQIVSAPTRIQNKRKVFLVTNTISPLISYSVAIPLILKGHYILAMPIATIIAGVTLEAVFGFMNKKFFKVSCFDKSRLKDLLKIGLPLMPNFIVYWIYNSSDKVMISHLLNTSATGVYSVASRIGHISNLIYTAFAGGWLYFAYSTMNDDDQVQMKSNMFEYLGAVCFAATVALMSVVRVGFKIIFPEEYFVGYLVTPYLFLAPLLLMLYQVIANQFTIVKKTYMNLVTLSTGAVLNVILNLNLIPIFGIEGASVATLIGYICSIAICTAVLCKMKLIIVNRKLLISATAFGIYFILWRFVFNENQIISTVSGLIVEGFYLYSYRDFVSIAIKKLFKKK